LHTTALRDLLGRFQAGDATAVEELLRRSAARLERLARAMLRRYPRVRQTEQTGDLVQEVLLTFLGALRQVPFASTREFYGLAAEHIRRRLLDLARRLGRPGGDVAALEQVMGGAERLASPAEDEDELERWQALHEAAEVLPVELREAFSLRFYHGWTNQEIADLFQVSLKTANRLCLRAQLRLRERLGDRPLPGEGEAPRS
jgi:RNA polymerase sigma factor (sigma-70 family)